MNMALSYSFVGIATASLVGNALGAKKRSLAINIGDLSIATIIIVQIFIGFAIHYAGKYFVYSFTKDEAVAMVAIKALPFLAVFTWFDALQGVSSGILRGTGKQNIGAVANVIAFYAIGLPMAWVMSFRAGFDVNGLMMGISFGSGFQVIVLIYLIKCNSNYIFSTILKEDNSIGKLSPLHHCVNAAAFPLTASFGNNIHVPCLCRWCRYQRW